MIRRLPAVLNAPQSAGKLCLHKSSPKEKYIILLIFCDQHGPLRLRSGVLDNKLLYYLAAQVIIVSTIFGTRKSMTAPPRFLPMASMSPDLNLSAPIPIKKGMAAIIAWG